MRVQECQHVSFGVYDVSVAVLKSCMSFPFSCDMCDLVSRFSGYVLLSPSHRVLCQDGHLAYNTHVHFFVEAARIEYVFLDGCVCRRCFTLDAPDPTRLRFNPAALRR